MSTLKGRTIAFLGSSVTYGAASGGVGIPELLAEATGCVSVKEAISGTTLANIAPDSYVARFPRIDAALSVDVFVCQLSTNDATKALPLGEPGCGDETTVVGAMEAIIHRAKAQWNCPVVFYTNPRYDSPAYARMVEALYTLKDMYALHIIDLWNDTSFDAVPDGWMADPIHPTLTGYTQGWLPVFRAALERIVTNV